MGAPHCALHLTAPASLRPLKSALVRRIAASCFSRHFFCSVHSVSSAAQHSEAWCSMDTDSHCMVQCGALRQYAVYSYVRRLDQSH